VREAEIIVLNSETLDSLFRQAVSAIDGGDIATLGRLLADHPDLLRKRLEAPGAWLRDRVGDALGGFFHRPYLLWFVAEDPVRTGSLPRNIGQVTRVMIEAARRERIENLSEQLDYALRLVAWSGVAARCGVQIELIDVMVEAGASLEGTPQNALVNGNLAAAARLVEHGARLTLGTALGLGRWPDARRLACAAGNQERTSALVLSALNGNAEAISVLIDVGVDVNAPSADLYSHATPLHHAVCSGALEAVKVLVEAGADLQTRDQAEDATPLGWAEYYAGEYRNDDRSRRFEAIAAYLRERESLT
jgi:peptide-methionine (S)-S-oxide reductase